MAKQMLIDASHAEETRVVILDNGRVEELDVETSTKKQIKGNIYLAKITRIEPSLQAAFVEYGGNRQGFLTFNEIHPDYYQIPVADREELKEIIKSKSNADDTTDDNEEVIRPRANVKRYRIQEVIRPGQVMLIQVIKEERGNKGAAVTTYLSLAGRFSVLMPNNDKGGAISRKITSSTERASLRDIIEKFPIPKGMGVIIRTAGQGKTKSQIKRDYDYLIKTWMNIREKTLESLAPCLIHQEGDIIKRSIRDVFTPDMDEIWVEGEEAFKTTRDFMKLLLPPQAKKVKQYKGKEPLFLTFNIEQSLETLHSNIVQLKSGGYMVIDQTEALVAVDVNSGRAVKEHDIEETALRTNLETCEELARQLKLRDMAGLVVIDFIDMMDEKNNDMVERKLKEALKSDKARIHVGKMSGFGLIEMSRQRLHSSFIENSYQPCPHCGGKGMLRSIESSTMHALHILEEASIKYPNQRILISLPLHVSAYLLNTKRHNLVDIEKKYGVIIQVIPDTTLLQPADFKLERIREDGERVNIYLYPPRIDTEKSNRHKNTNKNYEKVEKIEKAPAPNFTNEEDEGETDTKTTAAQQSTDKKAKANKRRNEWRKKGRERRFAEKSAATESIENETQTQSNNETAPSENMQRNENMQLPKNNQIDKDIAPVLTPENEPHFKVVEEVSLSETQKTKTEEKSEKSPRKYANRRTKAQKAADALTQDAGEVSADITPDIANDMPNDMPMDDKPKAPRKKSKPTEKAEQPSSEPKQSVNPDVKEEKPASKTKEAATKIESPREESPKAESPRKESPREESPKAESTLPDSTPSTSHKEKESTPKSDTPSDTPHPQDSDLSQRPENPKTGWWNK